MPTPFVSSSALAVLCIALSSLVKTCDAQESGGNEDTTTTTGGCPNEEEEERWLVSVDYLAVVGQLVLAVLAIMIIIAYKTSSHSRVMISDWRSACALRRFGWLAWSALCLYRL
jgi:hypothetical protein